MADGGAPAPFEDVRIVGRRSELASLDAFVAALPTGPRALLLRGPPGIGKTTLWHAAVARSRAAGFRVLVGRPVEDEMPLALVGLVDLFEPAGVDAARLLAGDDPLVRGRTVLEELRRLAAEAPTVVAIDDLQWLDEASARALRYALRRLAGEPIGVVATLRAGSDDPLSLAVSLLPGRLQTVELGPLGPGALRALLSGTVESISRPLLRAIHETSGGNALYALELARALRADESAHDGRAHLPPPASVREAISGRLGAAPAELAPVLDTVAALGPVPLAELRGALPDADVDRLVVLAADHELLVLDEDLTVRFTHPLVGSVVYERLGPLARRSLHARLAGRTTDPDVRARHLAAAYDEPDAAVAALLEEAARRAGERGAPELASEFARRSVLLTPADDPDAAQRRALAEIEHLATAGEVGRAVAAAEALVASLPPGPRRAEVLALQAYVDTAAGEGSLLRALEEAGEDELLRARILDLLAWFQVTRQGDVERGAAWAAEAVAIAERLGDRGLRMRAESLLAHLESLRGLPDSGRMARAVAIEDELGAPPLGRRPRVIQARVLLSDGDLGGARAASERNLDESLRSGAEFLRPYRLSDLSLVEYAAGDLRTAAERVRKATEAAADAEDPDAESVLLYPRALIEAGLGHAAEARAAASRLLEWSEALGEKLSLVRARGVLGLLALSEGDAQGAAAELVRAAGLLEELGIAHHGAYVAAVDAVEALAASGDRPSAVAILERLERAAASMGTPWPLAAVERSRGHVLLAAEDPDGAAAALEDAGDRFEQLGYRLDAARSDLARGRALLRAGHRTLAAELLADVRRRFAEMGAALWEARAVEELERAAPGRAGGELTDAELRVAALVAEGRKNREIGETLFMSVATVEAHLTRMYRKLGLRSRTELARWMLEDGARADDA